MKKVLSWIMLYVFVISLFPVATVSAAGEKKVSKIKVVGNIRVAKNTILNKIKTHEGDYFDAKTTSEDIGRIFQMGYFSNVKIDVKEDGDNVEVLFILTERPFLEKINVSGNSKIKTKYILKKLSSKEGEILNEKDAVFDVEVIKELYAKKGFVETAVSYKIDEDAVTNKAILNFSVDEGGKKRIKEINFKGVKAYKESKLKKYMQSKEKSLFNSGKFDQAKFENDLDTLKAFYYSQGYLDMSIADVKQSLRHGKNIYIEITIDEGTTYKVSSVNLKGNLLFPEAKLRENLRIALNNVFIPSDLSRDMEMLRDFYWEKGYINVKISPETVVNREAGTLDVNIEINANEIVYVNEIRIVGNKKTKDKVIRREFNVYPGEVFNGVKIKRTLQRLQNMGYFSKVDKLISPTDDPAKKDLIVEVEEAKTGEVGFGAGYSSVDNFIGFVEIAQTNFDYANFPYFTGGGQKLRLRSEFGRYRTDFVLSYTQPWLFDKKLAFGFDLYNKETSYSANDWDEERRGFNFRLGKPVGEFTRADLTYTFEKVDIFDMDDDVGEFIKSQEGVSDVSKVAFKLTRDTRNSIFLPTHGNKLQSIFEYAGVGGDVNYYKVIGVYDQFFHLGDMFDILDQHVLEIYLRAGVVEEHGDSTDVPLFDRFFLGGGAPNMRGFDFREISPRDENGESIGGKTSGHAMLEYTFPLITSVRGALFCDAGNVFLDAFDYDFDDINVALGFGLKIQLPIGPIRLDYGIPVVKDDANEDASGRFTFNIGTTF